jgi:hypothetical protein
MSANGVKQETPILRREPAPHDVQGPFKVIPPNLRCQSVLSGRLAKKSIRQIVKKLKPHGASMYPSGIRAIDSCTINATHHPFGMQADQGRQLHRCVAFFTSDAITEHRATTLYARHHPLALMDKAEIVEYRTPSVRIVSREKHVTVGSVA